MTRIATDPRRSRQTPLVRLGYHLHVPLRPAHKCTSAHLWQSRSASGAALGGSDHATHMQMRMQSRSAGPDVSSGAGGTALGGSYNAAAAAMAAVAQASALTGPRVVRCDVCNATFAGDADMQQHLQVTPATWRVAALIEGTAAKGPSAVCSCIVCTAPPLTSSAPGCCSRVMSFDLVTVCGTTGLTRPTV